MMKKILFFTFILFAFTACEKDDPDTDFTPYVEPRNTADTTGNGGGGGGGIPGGVGLIATIDGQNFTASTTNAMSGGNEIVITAIGPNFQKFITLSFPSSISVGKHNFNKNSIDGQYRILGAAGSKDYIAASAPLLDITSIDIATKKVSGKFHFTGFNAIDATDSIAVNNGSFNITYK